MNKNNVLCLMAVAALTLAGCAVSTDDTIMVGPAARTGGAEENYRQVEGLPTTVALLPFANETTSNFAFEAVRRTMANHFATKNYRWLHWRDVDRRLQLAGIDDVSALESAELMQILSVDGLIYGNITHFNKTFAGVYSQIAVGVELRFVNSTGDVIWSVDDVRRSHSGGISSSPVGLIMNALVAARHLYGDTNLYRAADDLGRDLAALIPEPASLSQGSKPRIIDVIHSGTGQYLRYGDVLEIALEGDAGMNAAATIDGLGVVDLEEMSAGQYAGQIALGRNMNLDGVVVTGRLQDSTGQVTSWISPYGLLTVDNTPPAPVTRLTAKPANNSVRLSWTRPMDTGIVGYNVIVRASETAESGDSFSAENSTFDLTGLTNFTPVYAFVSAVDRAGNIGTPVMITTMAAPDERFGIALPAPTMLPAVISGNWRMTAANGPYRLAVSTRIATDGVLLVGPGVRIGVAPGASLSVLGELQTFGTAASPVTINDIDDQGYSEFLILQSAQPVALRHVMFHGGGIPVQVKVGAPLIENSEFLNNDFNAISIEGTSRPTIRGNRIAGAGASAVVVQGQAQPVFEGNSFEENQPFHIQNGSSYPLNLKRNTFNPPASNMTVLGEADY